jgi:hypothetical protein
MPKKVPRNNPRRRSNRTVQGSAQSAASLLQRIRRGAGDLQAPTVAAPATLDRLRLLLPEELRQHLIEVLEKPGELVLFTDSAVWAGRLKLAAAAFAGFAAGRRQVVRLLPRGS